MHMHARAHACVCVCMCMRACVCVDTSVYVYIPTSEFKSPRVCQYIPLNKHSSVASFEKHLVRLTNQGLPNIIPQYPLETALTVT